MPTPIGVYAHDFNRATPTTGVVDGKTNSAAIMWTLVHQLTGYLGGVTAGSWLVEGSSNGLPATPYVYSPVTSTGSGVVQITEISGQPTGNMVVTLEYLGDDAACWAPFRLTVVGRPGAGVYEQCNFSQINDSPDGTFDLDAAIQAVNYDQYRVRRTGVSIKFADKWAMATTGDTLEFTVVGATVPAPPPVTRTNFFPATGEVSAINSFSYGSLGDSTYTIRVTSGGMPAAGYVEWAISKDGGSETFAILPSDGWVSFTDLGVPDTDISVLVSDEYMTANDAYLFSITGIEFRQERWGNVSFVGEQTEEFGVKTFYDGYPGDGMLVAAYYGNIGWIETWIYAAGTYTLEDLGIYGTGSSVSISFADAWYAADDEWWFSIATPPGPIWDAIQITQNGATPDPLSSVFSNVTGIPPGNEVIHFEVAVEGRPGAGLEVIVSKDGVPGAQTAVPLGMGVSLDTLGCPDTGLFVDITNPADGYQYTSDYYDFAVTGYGIGEVSGAMDGVNRWWNGGVFDPLLVRHSDGCGAWMCLRNPQSGLRLLFIHTQPTHRLEKFEWTLAMAYESFIGGSLYAPPVPTNLNTVMHWGPSRAADFYLQTRDFVIASSDADVTAREASLSLANDGAFFWACRVPFVLEPEADGNDYRYYSAQSYSLGLFVTPTLSTARAGWPVVDPYPWVICRMSNDKLRADLSPTSESYIRWPGYNVASVRGAYGMASLYGSPYRWHEEGSYPWPRTLDTFVIASSDSMRLRTKDGQVLPGNPVYPMVLAGEYAAIVSDVNSFGFQETANVHSEDPNRQAASEWPIWIQALQYGTKGTLRDMRISPYLGSYEALFPTTEVGPADRVIWGDFIVPSPAINPNTSMRYAWPLWDVQPDPVPVTVVSAEVIPPAITVDVGKTVTAVAICTMSDGTKQRRTARFYAGSGGLVTVGLSSGVITGVQVGYNVNGVYVYCNYVSGEDTWGMWVPVTVTSGGGGGPPIPFTSFNVGVN